jgi:hypothetical protein
MSNARRCTCAGTEPGYPQHEYRCMLVTGVDPDLEDDDGPAVEDTDGWDCGSGQCDPNTGCPACTDDERTWTRAR